MNNCSKKTIDGIKCNVQNCVYHNPNYKCEAGCIEVGPNHADTTNQVYCATFKAK